MTKIDKLKKKLKMRPRTFSYKDIKRILEHEGYIEDIRGKTSGSRVKFINNNGSIVEMHKPHPASEVKRYAIEEIAIFLEREGKL